MELKIGLVARCLNTEHVRGMGKYVFELLRQLQDHNDLDWYVFADDINKPMTVPSDARAQTDVFEFKGDRFRLWEQIGLPLRTLKHDVDILHCTESTLPLWQPKPTVVTMHDTLMWEDLHEGVVASTYFDKLLPAALNKSAAIITISESSKNDILKKWPWLESKLSVIPHGIANEYFVEDSLELPKSLQTQIGEDPYIIYLGGPMERKRFSWALNVLGHCKHKSLKLIACGYGADARRDAIQSLPINLQNRVYFAEFLSDADLLALYKNAQAVLYPTLYEGFGFPAIEAQAAGVPVIFSALGSLVELIGPLAIVVPPFELDAWLAALNDALLMGEARIKKAYDAKVWACKFTWAESAEKHLAVYRKAVKDNT
jgi:glycosyltransferase involved in cell wall biosynthesis